MTQNYDGYLVMSLARQAEGDEPYKPLVVVQRTAISSPDSSITASDDEPAAIPVITPSSIFDGTASPGSTLTADMNAESDVLSWYVQVNGSPVSWASIASLSTRTARITLDIPSDISAGTYAIAVQASNSAGSSAWTSAGSFTLESSAGNEASSAITVEPHRADLTVSAGDEFAFDLTAHGNSGQVSWTASSTENVYLTVNVAPVGTDSAHVTGRTDALIEGGVYSFTITASDGISSAETSVNIAVVRGGVVPIIEGNQDNYAVIDVPAGQIFDVSLTPSRIAAILEQFAGTGITQSDIYSPWNAEAAIGDPEPVTRSLIDWASPDVPIVALQSVSAVNAGVYVYGTILRDVQPGTSIKWILSEVENEPDAQASLVRAAEDSAEDEGADMYFFNSNAERIDYVPQDQYIIMAVRHNADTTRSVVIMENRSRRDEASPGIASFELSDTARANIAAALGISSRDLHVAADEDISDPVEPSQSVLNIISNDGNELAVVLNTLSVSETGYYAFLVNVPDELLGKSIADVKLYAISPNESAGNVSAGFMASEAVTGSFFNMNGQRIAAVQREVIGTARLTAGQNFGVYIGSAAEIRPEGQVLPVAVIEAVELTDEVLMNLSRTTSIDVGLIRFLRPENIGEPLDATNEMYNMVNEEGMTLLYKLNTISVDVTGYYAFQVNVPGEYVGSSLSELRMLLIKREGFADSEVRAAIPGVVNGMISYGEITNLFGLEIDRLEQKVLVIGLLQAGESFSVYLAKILLMMLLTGGCNSGIGIVALSGVIVIAGVKFFKNRH